MFSQETIERVIERVFANQDFGLNTDQTFDIKTALGAALVQQLAPDTVVSLSDAARELGINYRTLRIMIGDGTGPKAIRLTEKLIGIRRSALTQWLDQRNEPAKVEW